MTTDYVWKWIDTVEYVMDNLWQVWAIAAGVSCLSLIINTWSLRAAIFAASGIGAGYLTMRAAVKVEPWGTGGLLSIAVLLSLLVTIAPILILSSAFFDEPSSRYNRTVFSFKLRGLSILTAFLLLAACSVIVGSGTLSSIQTLGLVLAGGGFLWSMLLVPSLLASCGPEGDEESKAYS